MEKENVTFVNSNYVTCEGEGSSVGHPKIYLDIKQDQISCPYCSKTFKLKK